jgi:transcriptional regulator with XRE-family HTH domain
MKEERPQSASSRFFKLAQQFRDKEFRDTYVAAHTRRFLARQMRKFRGDLSQTEFAEQLGKQQTIVSRLENPNYSGWTLSTLLEIANKLNVGVIVRFVDFPSFLKFTDDFSESAVHPASYEQEVVDDFARVETEKEALEDLQINFDNVLFTGPICEHEGVLAIQPISSVPTIWSSSSYIDVGMPNFNLLYGYNPRLSRSPFNLETSQIAALIYENTQLKEENEKLKAENERLLAIVFTHINPTQSEPVLPQKGQPFPFWSQQPFGSWQ